MSPGPSILVANAPKLFSLIRTLNSSKKKKTCLSSRNIIVSIILISWFCILPQFSDSFCSVNETITYIRRLGVTFILKMNNIANDTVVAGASNAEESFHTFRNLRDLRTGNLKRNYNIICYIQQYEK